MRCFVVGLALAFVTGRSQTFAQQRPEALEKLEAYRAALRTGHVEWSMIDHMTLDVYAGETRFKTSKFAEDDHILIERGNEDGVVVRTEDGAPETTMGNRPHGFLQKGEQRWWHPDDPLQHTTVEPLAGGSRFDIRSLGVLGGAVGPDIHDTLWRDYARNPSAWKFEEGGDGDLHVVSVETGHRKTTYWLDPDRAWSPVRVRNEHDRYGWSEVRSTLKQFDGVWFPQVVEIFSSRYKDGREPEKIIRVHSAAFNRPEHPQRLTPADIGLEPGMHVCVRGADMKPEMMGNWDGEKVVSFQEFAERLHRGEVTEGPSFIRAAVKADAKLAKERAAAAGAAGGTLAVWTGSMTVEQARKALLLTPKEFESLWEAYTRAFIKKYKLNAEQTQKALSILKSCQERGEAHVSKHKSDLDRLDERVKAFAKLKGDERAATEAQIKGDREKLLKPLNDIFEQQLKPRLDKLPTRAQRKAAEQGQPSEQSGKAADKRPAADTSGKPPSDEP